ncbi:MAG: aryl-sulfate sulfotransferase [Candidatus Kapaibacteriales bacterium]
MFYVLQTVIFLLTLPFLSFALQIEFHYPLNNTSMHSIRTPIIIRFTQPIDLNDVINSIEIRGNKNGKYNFEVALSSDKRTISITTKEKFKTNERIEVKCNDINFVFYTTNITPKQQVELFLKHFSDTYPEISNAIRFTTEDNTQTDQTLSDTIPADFPQIIINKSTNPSDGFIYIANFGMGTERSYIMILDKQGKPVKYRKVRVPGFDFKMQPNGLITNNRIIASYIPQGWGWATAIMEIMDENLNLIDSVQCDSYYIADFHEFKMLPNGHFLLLSYDPQPIDMSQVIPNGNPNAIVLGSIIQELDENKKVVFQWRSWDHIPMTDTYSNLTDVALDPVHTNAIELDYDGNILISSRHISEITKISRKTGEIIWRLGGKKNMFTFINEHNENAPTYFSYQHDIRRLPNGNITLYDNGNQHNPPHSRAVEYKLDEKNFTAELVWEYRNDPDIFGETMGSTQRLHPSGNTLIGWGGVSSQHYRCLSEVTPEKEVVFELSFPKGASFTTTSYRAYKYPYPPNLPEAVVQFDDIQLILTQQSPNDTLKFDSDTITTGVSLVLDDFVSIDTSFVRVEKYHYSPLYPKFRVNTPLVNEYKVFVRSAGISFSKARLKFDLNKFPYSRHWQNLIVWRRNFNDNYFYPLTSLYLESNKELICETDTLDGEYIFATSDIYEAPTVPILHEPRDGSVIRFGKHILFRWTGQGYSTNYDFQVASDPSFNSTIYSSENLNSNSLSGLANISDTGKYFWRVRAKNNYGESEWSKPFSFIVRQPFLHLISPIGNEIWEKGKTYQIEWSHNLNNDFSIVLYRDYSPYQYIVDSIYSSFGKYLWTIPDVIPEGTRYKIMVQSISEKEYSAISPEFFSIVTSSPSSVFDNKTNNDKIYILSPSSELTINMNTPINEIYQVGLLDLFGRKVKTFVSYYFQNENIVTLHIGELSSGVYLLRITTSKGELKFPILKN